MALVGCNLTDSFLENLLDNLQLCASTLEHLDLTENDLTSKAMFSLKPVLNLKSAKKFRSLTNLILDKNKLYD